MKPDLNSKLAEPLARLMLARHLGISKQAVSKWPRVPHARVEEVAEFFQIAPAAVKGILIRKFVR